MRATHGREADDTRTRRMTIEFRWRTGQGNALEVDEMVTDRVGRSAAAASFPIDGPPGEWREIPIRQIRLVRCRPDGRGRCGARMERETAGGMKTPRAGCSSEQTDRTIAARRALAAP